MSATFLLYSSPSNFLHFPSYIPVISSLNPNQNPLKTPKLDQPLTRSRNPELSVSSEPISQSNAAIKMPTAPWMKGPLLLQPHEVLNPSRPKPKKKLKLGNVGKAEQALTGKESGVRGKKAMKKIIRNVEKLQQNQNSGDTQRSLEQFEFGDCLEEVVRDGHLNFGGKMPWSREERIIFKGMKKEKVVTAAELSLEKDLLQRLRGEAARMRKWVKVKKAGVTQDVVDEIKLIWRNNELVMVKFDVPLCRNMDRAQEIIEMKTGGLVVRSKKDTLVIYRGKNYQLSSRANRKLHASYASGQEKPPSEFRHLDMVNENRCLRDAGEDPIPTGCCMEENGDEPDGQAVNGSLCERETERLLDGLGPRFTDWWMRKPLPVDADLLPEVVPGFRPPIRLCPPHTRSKLTDTELTYLRKLAHPLPTHFVLGRNRKLQGLAAAILKLWEKSLIAKIAVKWGIPNTNNEEMANELKHLTGGVLLLRNKFFIILYRGKDFIPYELVDLISNREVELRKRQLHEEDARLKALGNLSVADLPLQNTSVTGTLSEFHDILTEFEDPVKGNKEIKLRLEADREKLERELTKQEHKLFILNTKIKRSVVELSKLNSAWSPAEKDADWEMMTEEERECFRKIGLKMDSSLVLGRRGIFDGVIEGLHQHWKHREVVKVITMQKVFGQVIYTAKSLEAESGGILVSVEKLKEGHAIIIYRGKNYRRPVKLMTENLLNKREALNRSLEMQRIGSLKFFAYQRQQAISELKIKLVEVHKAKKRMS